MSRFEFEQLEPVKQDCEKIKEREIDEKIKNLLEQGMPLKKMAEILGIESGGFFETIGKQTDQRSPVVRFDAMGFKKKVIENILDNETALPESYIHQSHVIIPPDPQEIIKGDGDGEWKEKEIIPRTRYIMELLSEMRIKYRIYDGENDPQMMRSESYKAFDFEMAGNQRKLILVCNEEGNATFIVHQIAGDVKEYFSETKEQLRSRESVSRIEYYFTSPEEYKEAVKIKLLEDGNSKSVVRELEEENKSRQESWEKMFGKLCDYIDHHGNCNVPITYDEDQKFARWVATQRHMFKTDDNKIRYADRYDKLCDIEFNFEPHQTSWNEMFAELCEYKIMHGDCNVSSSYEDKQLSVWIRNQRTRFRDENYKQKHIREFNRLVEIGFDFDPHETIWDGLFEKLCEYKREHGNCNVPFGYEKDPQLAGHVLKQRQIFKSEKNKIAYPDRYKKLLDIGFDFDPNEVAWEESFKKLLDYIDENGDCNVKEDYEKDPQLARWALRQRQIFKSEKNKIAYPDRYKKLLDIGFDFNPLETAWNEKFKMFCAYKDDKSRKIGENSQLVAWIDFQRKFFSNENNRVKYVDRYNKLNEAGFRWRKTN